MDPRRRRLRERIAEPRLILVPGVYDALSARLAEQTGFEVAFVSGSSLANVQFGLPDLGLLTMSEVAESVRRIADTTTLPLIADADTGYGNADNVYRTVQAFAAAGAAAVMLEDQVTPKRCGHFEGKEVVTRGEMVEKILAFQEARGDTGLLLLARTDAYASQGLGEAIARGQLFAELGADMVFVEAVASREDLCTVAREIPVPTVVNLVEGGKTPLLGAAEVEAMGFRLALFAGTLMRVSAYAVRHALQTLRRDGSSAALTASMLTWDERQALAGLPRHQALEAAWVEKARAIVSSRERDRSHGEP